MPRPIELNLGPDVIERLIPHRRPFLMIDRLVTYERGETPRLVTARFISSNEPVFEGHFPGVHLWPGVYTLEAMGQSCHVLSILGGLERAWEQRGGDPLEVTAALRMKEAAARFVRASRPEDDEKLSAMLNVGTEGPGIGFTAAVDVKLLAPVFAGERLDLDVSLTHALEGFAKFAVQASVGGRVVAKGTLTGARA